MPRMTLWGMYQYDPTMFDNLQLPTGMDNSIMIEYIMQEVGDLWPYYQVPPRLKLLIGNWSKRKLAGWQKMYDALNIDYNPLENYNRREEGKEEPDIVRKESPDITIIDTPDLTRKRTPDLTTTDTPNITSKYDGTTKGDQTTSATSTTTTAGSNSSSNEQQISAFDAPSYVPRQKDIVSGTSSDHSTGESGGTEKRAGEEHGTTVTSGTQKRSETGTDTTTETGTNTRKESGTRTITEQGRRTHESVIKGNIGVTTSQQMLEEELNIRLYDLYETICGQFAEEFIVTIY